MDQPPAALPASSLVGLAAAALSVAGGLCAMIDADAVRAWSGLIVGLGGVVLSAWQLRVQTSQLRRDLDSAARRHAEDLRAIDFLQQELRRRPWWQKIPRDPEPED